MLLVIGLIVGLAGCFRIDGASKNTAEEANLLAARSAVLAVPGVTGGDVEVSWPGSFSSWYFTCGLESDAATRDELLAILEDVGRAVVDTVDPSHDPVIQCRLSNGIDTVDFADIVGGSSMYDLRQHYGP